MKEFFPLFQTMLGGALTLLGVCLVQGKSDKRERARHYRETIQQCYELLLKMESCYLDESVTFFKGVRDGNLIQLKESEFGNQGSEAFDKALALIELYFPEHVELIVTLAEVETEVINFNSSVIDGFSTLSKELFDEESDRLSEKLGEAISNIKEALSNSMRNHVRF